jgi:hypothetical protein
LETCWYTISENWNNNCCSFLSRYVLMFFSLPFQFVS